MSNEVPKEAAQSHLRITVKSLASTLANAAAALSELSARDYEQPSDWIDTRSGHLEETLDKVEFRTRDVRDAIAYIRSLRHA